jgi:hypothetical protein
MRESEMFTNYEAINIIEEYNKQVSQKAKKLRLIMALSAVSLTLILFWIILTVSIQNEVKIFFAALGGLIIIGLLLVLFFSSVIMGSSVTFNYLFPKVYEKINADLNLELEYKTKNKVDNRFLEAGKIFTKHARVYSYRDVSGRTENNNRFQILDCSLITGGGQYQQVHLNGMYLFFKVPSAVSIQIRTHGKPQGKNLGLEKFEQIEEVKVYLPSGKTMDTAEKLLLQKFKELKMRLSLKYLYLSLGDNILHLAYVPKPRLRAQNKVTPEKLNQIYQEFKSELDLIDEFVNIFDF